MKSVRPENSVLRKFKFCVTIRVPRVLTVTVKCLKLPQEGALSSYEMCSELVGGYRSAEHEVQIDTHFSLQTNAESKVCYPYDYHVVT
jgi:hypothetical protein